MNMPSCLTSLWIRRCLVSVCIWTWQAHSVHIDVFWSCPTKSFYCAYMCLAHDLDPRKWRLQPCSWPCYYTSGFLFSYFLFLLFASVLSSRALRSLRLVVLSKCNFCGAPTVYTMGMHFCRLSNLYRLHIHIVYSSHPTKLVYKVLH